MILSRLTEWESQLKLHHSLPTEDAGGFRTARWSLALLAANSQVSHFDVPWNPSRLEQRNGRIDRKLQPSDTVYCHYFVYTQRLEDRVLRALVRKTETIRAELGSLSQVIDTRLSKILKDRITRADAGNS